jgi:hypothetical protein
MRVRLGLALGLLLCPAPGLLPADAQTFGPTLRPTEPRQLPQGLHPLYQPQHLPPVTGPVKPGEDIAFGAYQRGYFVTAFREAFTVVGTLVALSTPAILPLLGQSGDRATLQAFAIIVAVALRRRRFASASLDAPDADIDDRRTEALGNLGEVGRHHGNGRHLAGQ